MCNFKDNWMKELGSEVAGGSEDFQQTQPKKPKTQLLSTGRLVKSCVPVSVERSDEDKDADENVGRRSCKNGETRWKWTIHRFVHKARGNRH